MPAAGDTTRFTCLVITDVDNTLIDTRLRDYRSFADTAAERGISMPSFSWFSKQRLRGASSREIGLALYRQNGEVFDLDSFLRDRHDRLDRTELFSLDTPVDGALDGLAMLHRAGAVVVAATLRSDRESLIQELNRLGMARYLADVITRDVVSQEDVGPYGTDFETLKRYKRQVLSVALTRTNVSGRRSVFVTDTMFDLAAAEGLGLFRIGVRTGYATERDLMAGSEMVVDHFGKVPEVLGI